MRGVHFFYSRKEESLRILAKFLATDNAEALEEGYRYAKLPPKPYATESAVQATQNHLAERDARFAQRKPPSLSSQARYRSSNAAALSIAFMPDRDEIETIKNGS